MKKIALILAVVLTLTLSGCTAQDTTTTQAGTSEPSVTSGAVSEPAETAEPAEKEENTTESTASAVNEVTVTGESAGTTTSPPAATQTPDKPAGTPPTAKPTAPPKPTDAQPSVTTPSPATPAQPTDPPKTEAPPPAMPTPTPEPTNPPKPKTAYDAPYDTAAMVADAKSYGESIGMTWSASLTPDNCSWEAPGATSPTLSGERLKAAIESSIRRIKKLQVDNGYQPGEFHFKVLFEASGSGEYTIYFLMG